MGIPLNFNRTRVTVLGFTLSLLFFLTSTLVTLGHYHQVQAVWAFLPSFVQIATAFSLALASLLLMVTSQRMDREGSSELGWFSAGELLMYQALALTISGAMQLYVGGLSLAFRGVSQELAGSTELASEIAELGRELTAWVHVVGAVVWFLFIYLAPLVFLIRVSLTRRRKLLLAVGCALIQATLFWISTYPYLAHARARGESRSHASVFVQQLWQPQLWKNRSLLVPVESDSADGTARNVIE